MRLRTRPPRKSFQRKDARMILEDRRDVDRDIQETLGLVPTFFEQVPDYLTPLGVGQLQEPRALRSDRDPEQVQGADRAGGVRRHGLPLLRVLPHGSGTPVRRQRRRNHRNGADRQEHDGLEHLPQHAAVRLRRVHPRVRSDRGARARANGRQRQDRRRHSRPPGESTGTLPDSSPSDRTVLDITGFRDTRPTPSPATWIQQPTAPGQRKRLDWSRMSPPHRARSAWARRSAL
jgi:hypothetical protein